MTFSKLLSQAFQSILDKELSNPDLKAVFQSEGQIANDYLRIRSMFVSSHRVYPAVWHPSKENNGALQLRLDRIESLCKEMKHILCNNNH